MRQKIADLLKDPLIKRLGKIYIITIILFFVMGFWKWRELPPQLPLFYSLPKSPEQLGFSWQLILLPLFSLTFFIINILLALFLYLKEKLAAYLLIISSTVFSVLLFITFIKIIFLIT